MSPRPLKGIAIGAGYFSAFHFDAWARLKGRASIGAVVALDADQARQVATDFDIEVSGSADQLDVLLAQIKPDFVDIMAPPKAHLALIKQCARPGLAIMCQKPLGQNRAEGQEIVDVATRAGSRFMAHENWRWQPWYRAMATLVGPNHLLGDVHTITSTTRLGDGWQDDAYLARQPYFRDYPRLLVFETGVHFLDVFRFLGGDVQSVYARLQKRNPAIAGEDSAQIICGLANGGTAIWDASRYHESECDQPRFTFGTMRIDCARGHIRLDETGSLWIKQHGEATRRLDFTPPKTGFAGDSVFATIEHFIQALENQTPFETDGRNYLKTLHLVDAAYRSAATGQVVFVEPS